MENANIALIMAVSTIIGVMLFALFSFFITSVSVWPETQDEIANAEQVAAFNAEYEVYQKSAMYGVDVISCLNKAKSNNEKYVEGGSFLGDGAYGTNYEINVTVEIKKLLTESLEVTAMQPNIGGNVQYRESVIHNQTHIVKDSAGTNLKMKDVFTITDGKQSTKFRENDYLVYNKTSTYDEFQINKVYNLVDSTVSDDNNILRLLIEHSNNPKQLKKNSETPNPNPTTESEREEYAKCYVYDPNNSKYGWTTATWSTYLYDFKQKKFKCTNVEYSDKTGRINKIEFKEL